MQNEFPSIPPFSQVTSTAMLQLFGQENGLDELLRLVENDARLSEALVEILASPMTPERKGTESRGPDPDSVRTLAATLDTGARLIASLPGRHFDTGALLLHAVAAGGILAEMGKVLEWSRPERFFFLGFFHDLGLLALDSLPGTGYPDVLKRVATGISLAAAERKVFGMDHEEAGRMLMERLGSDTFRKKRFFSSVCLHPLDPARLARESSALAEWIGYSLPLPRGIFSCRARNLLSTLSAADALAVGRAAQDRAESVGRALHIPLPDRGRLQDILVKRSYDLSLSNARYAQSQAELEGRVSMLEAITRVLTCITHALHRDSLYFSVLEAVLDVFPLRGVFLLEGTGRGGFTGFAARRGEGGEPEVERVRVRKQDISPYLRKCFIGRTPLRLRNPGEEQLLCDCLGKVSTVWIAPIHGKEGFVGVLGLGVGCRASWKAQDEDILQILEILCSEIALSIENTRLFQRIRRQANTDALTAMNNRRTILKILSAEFARFKRKGTPITVALFDLDRFKQFNDRYGHVAGDRYLAKAARLLRKGIRASDFIGRYGGDEFLAVFPGTTAEEAFLVAQRMYGEMEKAAFPVPGTKRREPFLISAGVAGAESWMTRMEELVQRADEALYHAKDAGRNTCRLHEPAPVPP